MPRVDASRRGRFIPVRAGRWLGLEPILSVDAKEFWPNGAGFVCIRVVLELACEAG